MTHCRSCIWNLRVCVQKCVCVCVSVAIGLSPLELDFPTLKHLALGVTASRHPSSHSDFPLNVLLLAACSRVSTIPSNHTQSSGHHPFPLAALTCFLLAYLLVAPNLIPGVFALHSWCLLCCSYCFFPSACIQIHVLVPWSPPLSILFLQPFSPIQTSPRPASYEVGGGETDHTLGHFQHHSSAPQFWKFLPFMSTVLLKSIAQHPRLTHFHNQR